MPSATNKGGSIAQNGNPNNYAAVDEATATQIGITNQATWVVTLKNVPTISNFQRGNALTYNAKGTRNPNADNALTVTNVNGPTKYICSGNWPIKI